MALTESELRGRWTAVLENDVVRLEFLLDAGPRIVRLVLHERPSNIFAEVPTASWPTVLDEPYEIIGGHRLWASPEARPELHIPDTHPVEVAVEDGSVRIVGGTLTREGVRPELTLALDGPTVRVLHTLRNEGDAAQTLAAWAITAFAPGGVATLPQPSEPPAGGPQLPNRNIVLWPYSSTADPRVELGDDAIAIRSGPGDGPFKLGYFSEAGRVSYERDGVRCTKSFAVLPDEPHADRGCNAETYVCDDFVELESLSPLRTIAPGEAIEHAETWLVELVDA